MINYINGDLFELLPTNVHADNPIVIPHIVNNINRMGSGFVVPLMKKWPAVPDSYHNQPFLFLGDVDYVRVEHNVYVANMVAQHGVVGPNNPKPIKYEALVKCMIDVRQLALQRSADLYCPMFGSGLAGGDWNFIEELINEIWGNLRVTIYKLEL